MRFPKLICSLTLAFLAFVVSPHRCAAEKRPNIVMIMVDDLGFSDLGCYGSQIQTPNLDALANGGLRFSQFYNTAKCHSSRVALLTGQYCIAAGDTSLSHAVTSAEVLKDAGYFTAMTGKWHLKKQPTDFGFQRFFGHLSGACNYFKGDDSFRLNGQPWQVPANDFYTTVANVDFGLQFLNEARQTDKPWFLYVAFNAPHAPLHALPQDYAKYEGKFDSGWDLARERRIEKQQRLKLLPDGVRPSPRPDHIPAWDSLSEPRQRFEAKRMATLAAMIDRVDQEVGRLVDDLRRNDELDNTLIWFVSDNGACPYDRSSRGVEHQPTNGDVSFGDSTGWAWARNTPFRFYKQNQFEGGICTSAIAYWPAGISRPSGAIVREPVHLIDLMPTFAALAEAKIPGTYPGRQLRPVSGVPLVSLLRNESLEREQPLHFLFSADRALRVQNWKAVSFRSQGWELYDLNADRTELNDLSQKYPERLKDMVETWTGMAKDVVHVSDKQAAAVSPAVEPKLHPEWTNFDRDPADGVRGSGAAKRGKRNSTKQAKTNRPSSIRGRKNTKLTVADGVMELVCSGDDPGLAWDRLPAGLAAGPYVLRFELNSKASGAGDVFFTTDMETSLPRGEQIGFQPKHDGSWEEHRIELTTKLSLRKLRLDVCAGEGAAQIRALQLTDRQGNVLLAWP